MLPTIDFGYAFAPPHRLTVCRPEASEKTLLDCYPNRLRVAWSYEDLRALPLLTNAIPRTAWEVSLTANLPGSPAPRATWERIEGWIPALVWTLENPAARVRIEVLGVEGATLIRVTVANRLTESWDAEVRCAAPRSWAAGYNPVWVSDADPGDTLLAGWTERADRVLLLGRGGDRYPKRGAAVLTLGWTVPPGGTRAGWIIRPYLATANDLPALRARAWEPLWVSAIEEWRDRTRGAQTLSIPDPAVTRALRGCLADFYVMREPIADGTIASTPGTEIYRAVNSIEPAIVAVALDQLGEHRDSTEGLRASLAAQDDAGDWADPSGWMHLLWATSGFKAWAVLTHWRLTRDDGYLRAQYPRLLAMSRFQERMRASTRDRPGARPGTSGLMPRGQGDAGLMDGDDFYGVFLPHNIWAVYADALALEAARAVGAPETAELASIHARALSDLQRALEIGSIREPDGTRWIPGAPGTTSGSRWGALNALYPCGLLDPAHPLIDGTLRRLESDLSPGGIPKGTGWLKDGMWVAITLDNVAQTHLALGNGEQAAAYLYAVLNHGSPLWTWCEERGPEPGSEVITGDLQHLYTPVAVVRLLRDMLVLEEGDGMHLARGTHPAWLDGGKTLGVTEAPTWFGRLSFELGLGESREALTVTAKIVRKADQPGPRWIRIHACLPGGVTIDTVAGTPTDGTRIADDGRSVLIHAPPDTFSLRLGLRHPPGRTAPRTGGDTAPPRT